MGSLLTFLYIYRLVYERCSASVHIDIIFYSQYAWLYLTHHRDQHHSSSNVKKNVNEAPLHQSSAGYHTPGIAAHFLRIFSSPNFSTYHFLPFTARGSMAVISFTKNALAGVQLQPAAIQKPSHSIHSKK